MTDGKPPSQIAILQRTLTEMIDGAYDAALQGGAGFESVDGLAATYRKEPGSPKEQAESMVRWQMGKAGATGFLTGLPGLVALPISLPANLTAVVLLQLRMAAAIAVLGGHDPRDDKVKAFVLMCLAGTSVNEVAKDLGIKLGTKLAEKALHSISHKAVHEINKRLGFRLATKVGEKGLINLGKAVPIVGGVVGAAFDAGTTRIVGSAAIRAFITDDLGPLAPDSPS